MQSQLEMADLIAESREEWGEQPPPADKFDEEYLRSRDQRLIAMRLAAYKKMNLKQSTLARPVDTGADDLDMKTLERLLKWVGKRTGPLEGGHRNPATSIKFLHRAVSSEVRDAFADTLDAMRADIDGLGELSGAAGRSSLYEDFNVSNKMDPGAVATLATMLRENALSTLPMPEMPIDRAVALLGGDADDWAGFIFNKANAGKKAMRPYAHQLAGSCLPSRRPPQLWGGACLTLAHANRPADAGNCAELLDSPLLAAYLVARTGSGKTLVIAMLLMREIARREREGAGKDDATYHPHAILLPGDLISQFYGEFERVTSGLCRLRIFHHRQAVDPRYHSAVMTTEQLKALHKDCVVKIHDPATNRLVVLYGIQSSALKLMTPQVTFVYRGKAKGTDPAPLTERTITDKSKKEYERARFARSQHHARSLKMGLLYQPSNAGRGGAQRVTPGGWRKQMQRAEMRDRADRTLQSDPIPLSLLDEARKETADDDDEDEEAGDGAAPLGPEDDEQAIETRLSRTSEQTRAAYDAAPDREAALAILTDAEDAAAAKMETEQRNAYQARGFDPWTARHEIRLESVRIRYELDGEKPVMTRTSYELLDHINVPGLRVAYATQVIDEAYLIRHVATNMHQFAKLLPRTADSRLLLSSATPFPNSLRCATGALQLARTNLDIAWSESPDAPGKAPEVGTLDPDESDLFAPTSDAVVLAKMRNLA